MKSLLIQFEGKVANTKLQCEGDAGKRSYVDDSNDGHNDRLIWEPAGAHSETGMRRATGS